MLRHRTASAVFIVALTVLAAVYGRFAFAFFFTAILSLGLYELYAVFRHAGHRPLDLAGYAAAVTLPALALTGHWAEWIVAAVTAAVLLPLFALLFRPDHHSVLTDWALTVAGALYVGLPAAHFVLLRNLPGPLDSFLYGLDQFGLWQRPDLGPTARGLGWFLLAQTITWLSDVGAYAVGRTFGQRKLAPAISPSKSVEGALGGLVCAALTALAANASFGLGLAPLAALALGVLLSVAGQLGDLAESLLKRQAGIKDSGALLPGHGGILDRLDSLLIAAVAAYYLVRLTG